MDDTVFQLRDARVTYPAPRGGSAVEALRGVSLSLERGVVLGVAGANGAGKTTLMELCVGALRPTSGVVSWFGGTRWDAGVRARIGFCPDVPALPKRLTVREVLRFFGALESLPARDVDARIDQLVDRLRLQDLLGQRAATLSRGNLLRVGVCQALIRPREIILCDESFAPLDPVAQVDLRTLLLEEAAAGAAVLVSSHQLDQLARIAHEIVIMRKGEVVRHLREDVVQAKQTIVLAVAGLPAAQVAALGAAHPAAWRAGDTLRIPWGGALHDRASAQEMLPGVPVVGVEPFNMEAVFLESVA